jgi:hypothetical protein
VSPSVTAITVAVSVFGFSTKPFVITSPPTRKSNIVTRSQPNLMPFSLRS